MMRLIILGFLLAISQSLKAAAPDGPSFSFINTAVSGSSLESMVVAGGSWTTSRELTHGAVLIVHPQGNLLFDSGLGSRVDEEFEENPFWAKALLRYHSVDPVIDQFRRSGFDPASLMAIIPSHLHWDHASGLVDFPGTPVWVRAEELAKAREGAPPAFLSRQIGAKGLAWTPIVLEEKPFLVFQRSLDIFGDGTVVLFDLSGHTAGQLGLFLHADGKRYLFIGDATWTLKGVQTRQPRPSFVNRLAGIDLDPEAARQRVEQLADLAEAYPDWIIVPAHDEYVARTLPAFPVFSGDAQPRLASTAQED